MGLLDDIFGKEEINRLKRLLVENNNALETVKNNLDETIKVNSKLVRERDLANAQTESITAQLKRANTDINRNATLFEEFRKTTITQGQITATTTSELRQQLADKIVELNDANSERSAQRIELEHLHSLFAERERQSWQKEQQFQSREDKFEEYRKQTATEQVIAATKISELRELLEEKVIEINNINSARDILSKEVQSLSSLIADKDRQNQQRERQYQDREIKLAEKSEKLQSERHNLEQKLTEFTAKETRWIRTTKIELDKYEKYKSLDILQVEISNQQVQLNLLEQSLTGRENDLVRRQITDETLSTRDVENNERQKLLVEQAAELADRTQELDLRQEALEEQASSLETFQARIDTLDDDTNQLQLKIEKFVLREQKQDLLQSERLAEIRDQRSALRKETKELNARATDVLERERVVKRLETQTQTLKTKNIQLKQENESLNQLVAEYASQEQAWTDLQSSHQQLQQKHSILKQSYQHATERAKDADRDRADVERLNLIVDKLTERVNIHSKLSSSLLNTKVLGSLTTEGDPESIEIDNGWLGFSGYGPWEDYVFRGNLEELGHKFFTLPDPDLAHIIVGRIGWTKDALLAQIDARQGEALRIYSQEMFFYKIVTDRDPFDEDDVDLLMAFAEDHPALQFLLSLSEPWPEVTTKDSREVFEVGLDSFGVSKSPLSFLGYQVGSTSALTATERRTILSQCFSARTLEFSDDSDDAYKLGWGHGKSAQRLYRIAHHIKSMTDGRVGKDYRKPQARKDWIADLKWLKNKYYSAFQNSFDWSKC